MSPFIYLFYLFINLVLNNNGTTLFTMRVTHVPAAKRKHSIDYNHQSKAIQLHFFFPLVYFCYQFSLVGDLAVLAVWQTTKSATISKVYIGDGRI
jgi:hypothetical protein